MFHISYLWVTQLHIYLYIYSFYCTNKCVNNYIYKTSSTSNGNTMYGLKGIQINEWIHCPCLIGIWFDFTVGEVCLRALKLSWLQFCKVFLSPTLLAWSGRWIFLTQTLKFLLSLLKCSQPESAKCSLIFYVSGLTWGNHIKPFTLWLYDGWEVDWYLPYGFGILVW
jgi:hypothetical protein